MARLRGRWPWLVMAVVFIVSGSVWAAIVLSSNSSSRPSLVIVMNPTAPAREAVAMERVLRQAPVVRWFQVTELQPSAGKVIEPDGPNLLPCYRPDCSASLPPLPETFFGVKVTTPAAVRGLVRSLENRPGVVAVITRTGS